jgi:hypothetical protein
MGSNQPLDNNMPRKKTVTDSSTQPDATKEATPVAEEPKKKVARRSVSVPATPAKAATTKAKAQKVKEAPAPVEAVAPQPEKKAAGRTRAKAVVQVPQEPIAEEKPKSRGRKAVKPEPAAAPETVAVETLMQGDSKSPLRRRTAAKKTAPKTEAVVDDIPTGDDLPVPIWRPVQKRQAKESRRPVEAEGDEEPRGRGRRGRGRKKPVEEPEAVAVPEAPPVEIIEGDRIEMQEEDVLIEAVFRKAPGSKEAPRPKREERAREPRRTREPKEEEPPKPVKPTRPLPPVKALIPIPDEAPQIVLRNGIPTLVRNKQVYPPLWFFGNCNDERRTNTVFEEMRLASEAGVHVHSMLVELEVDAREVDSAVAFAGYMLKKAVEIDRDAQLLFRIVIVAPKGWDKEFPEARWKTLDGHLAEPSLSDDKFWGVARECVNAFVRKLRLLDLKDNILGVHLERGEWFVSSDMGYDDSQAARLKFRDWARARYVDDEVAIRASWFDGSVSFDNIEVPPYQPEGSEGDRFVRSSRKQRRYVDYHLFLSDMTHDRIADLAHGVKEASDGYFLVGVSYGYTFEWSHPQSGHLSLGKLLRTPEIDFIAGPPSYRSREPGGTAPFPCPIDSLALNGKLFVSEEDFKTAIGAGPEPDDFNPVIKTPQALESIHWRGAGAALAHASGENWMDIWGNGWLKTSSIWDRGSQVRQALTLRMGSPLKDPEVAVFIDERALAYLVDPQAFQLLVQDVREAVLRSGLSAGFYLLSDLQHREKFPEAKLYLFLNAWDIRPELRSAIKNRLQRGNKVLFWLYSAGLFDAGRDSLERAREVTGIAIKPQPYHSKSGTTLINRRHPLSDAFADRSTIGGSQLEPSYFAINEDALVLGEYSQTGLPSFLVKEFKNATDPTLNWTSVFMGEPEVNPALIRALGHMAGAHIWNYQDDLVHVGEPFLTIHCKNAGPRTLTLPSKFSAYNLPNQQWAVNEATNVRFHANEGSTHVFMVGIKEELEHMLKSDPSGLLKMDQLPPRAENTVRFDAVSFDVPIMKLGAWIEGSDDEENVEDWLLRPPVLEDESSEETEMVRSNGRRRRRRRNDRQDRGGAERPMTGEGETRREGADMQFDDLDLSVRFRRRD